MTYEIAQVMRTDVTYGWLIETAPSGINLMGGTSQAVVVGVMVSIGGDIVTSVNGTRIMNFDDLSSYLEENTLPGQTDDLGVVRNNEAINVLVALRKLS